MPRFAILDPLTLMGRALATEIQRRFPDAELGFFHTLDDEEHEVTPIAGHAALVPPLSGSTCLSEWDVVLLAADRTSPRLKVLEQALEDDPTLVFIDASSLSHYRHITSPALDAHTMTSGVRLRPAHPSIVVAGAVVQALAAFEPTAMTISAVDPVSIFGKDAVLSLAHQASQRLQGEDVTETIDQQVAAFNMTAHSGVDLAKEASQLFPKLEVVATRTAGGCFHGHLTLLSLAFGSAVSLDVVIEALEDAPSLSLADFPLNLDGVSDRDGIWLTTPETSPSGRTLAFQAMVDGTRIGGAVTVATILQGLQ